MIRRFVGQARRVVKDRPAEGAAVVSTVIAAFVVTPFIIGTDHDPGFGVIPDRWSAPVLSRTPAAPSAGAEAPSPGVTLTERVSLPGPDRTVLSYQTSVAPGETRLVRRTISATAPAAGVATETLRGQDATATVTAEGSTRLVPGPTETVTVTVTETAPASETTVTVAPEEPTVTVTESVAAPGG